MTLFQKIAAGLAALIVLLVLSSAFTLWYVGAWRLVFPSHHHDSVAPTIPAGFGADNAARVLVFSKTNSFRHKDGIPGAKALFNEIAIRRDWAVYHSENGALFDAEHLARFDVVVFSNASGDVMSEDQERAFQTWLEAGGGWIGIHSAGDKSHREWEWYQDTLIGGLFTAHIMDPQTQEARVVVEDGDHPATRDLPAEFMHAEEWYSWDASAREKGFHVLLTVDESSYTPFARGFGAEMDLRMGDHPVVWARCVGKGRALYSAMGHWADAYANPAHAKLLENAIEWTAGVGRGGAECIEAR